MACQSSWQLRILLVILQLSIVLCQNSSYELQYRSRVRNLIKPRLRPGGGELPREVQIGIIVGAFVTFFIIVACIVRHCVLRCRQKQRHTGVILGNSVQQRVGNHTVQPVVMQHSPTSIEEITHQFNPHIQARQQHIYSLNQPTQQKFLPQNKTMQQFPQQYHPMQQELPPQYQPLLQELPPQYQQLVSHTQQVQQFQRSAMPSQFQYSPTHLQSPHNTMTSQFSNSSEAPGPYEDCLKRKY